MFLLGLFAILGPAAATAQSTDGTGLVIYSVAGAGGLTGAGYRQDTIILFNPTQQTISCSACAIQYHSATLTTTTWTVYKLPQFTIPAGGYYMIAGSDEGLSSKGDVAPIPYDYELDTLEGKVTSSLNIMSSVAAAVALTSSQTALTNKNKAVPCTDGSSTVIDEVGYGNNVSYTTSTTSPTAAGCYAGSGPAFYDGNPTYGFQMGAVRSNRCVTTSDNANDFVEEPIGQATSGPTQYYFNSASTPTVCPTGTQLSAVVAATPSNAPVGGAITFTAQITPASSPASNTSSVLLRFDSPYFNNGAITGPTLQMYDDGTNGDATAGDGIYTLATTIPADTVASYTYPTNVTVVDANGDTFTGSTLISPSVPPPSVALSIYEVAGGGGNDGSLYSQDTIVLFNPSQSTVTCAACAIQIPTGSGSSFVWNVYKLPALNIPAGGYYMIAASAVSSNASATTPASYDYTLGTIEGSTIGDLLSASNGVVALTSNATVLTASTSAQCGSGLQLVDMVGYGSSSVTDPNTTATPATCYQGKGGAYYDGSVTYGYKMGITRKNACINTGDNSSDWANTPIAYLNSASTATVCPAGTQLSAAVAATPSTPSAGGQITVTAAVTPATNPDSSAIQVALDFNTPYYGGQTLAMYDDGTHGDATAGDGIYTLTTTLPASVSIGYSYPLNVTVTDANGDAYTGSTSITIPATAGNNSIRIIAFYGAGNLSKSMYGRDTVILFNPSQQPITMNNWSLQTGGTTGSFTTVYKLPVATIPAGGYYAITGSGVDYISSSGCTSSICNTNYAYDYELKTLEGTQTDTDNILSSTNTTALLASTQTALGTCPLTSPNLVDLIGVAASDGSTTVSCFAGSGSASYTPTTLDGQPTNVNGVIYAYATVRKNKCGNTFDNAHDYMLGYIDFANSQTAPTVCPMGTQISVNSATMTPSSVGLLDPVLLTASVTPGATSSGVSVTADLSNIGLSATTQLYDDGTHGDVTAGDGVYSLATAAQAGNVGPILGLIVSATDTQGDVAQNVAPFTVQAGTFTMTAQTTSATVAAGGVATFPITIAGFHGYTGVLNITCTGVPNPNSLGIPTNTSCVSTPSEVSLQPDGTAQLSVAIAMGLTTTPSVKRSGTVHSAGAMGWPMSVLAVLSIVPLAVVLRRRKRLLGMLMIAVSAILALGVSACGHVGPGLGGLQAQPGTYTYTVTATDSAISTVTQSVTFTVTVQ